ncbi:2-(S)-hydroxypropyl-CoM dehydrogenase domain protein [delta proteobacterium NaphS2]|nr:2-(S)-hydroxypropyl-CoM dehydrogenase domain protein [delta proteobacterium NaphS2]
MNVTGTFLCSTLYGKAMIEQGEGKIINLGSVASVVGRPSNIMDAIAYNASKGAILTFTNVDPKSEG